MWQKEKKQRRKSAEYGKSDQLYHKFNVGKGGYRRKAEGSNGVWLGSASVNGYLADSVDCHWKYAGTRNADDLFSNSRYPVSGLWWRIPLSNASALLGVNGLQLSICIICAAEFAGRNIGFGSGVQRISDFSNCTGSECKGSVQ